MNAGWRAVRGGLVLYLLAGIGLMAVAAATRPLTDPFAREAPMVAGLALAVAAYLLARRLPAISESMGTSHPRRIRTLLELAALFGFVLLIRVPAVLVLARPLEKAPLLLLLAWLGTRPRPRQLSEWGFTRWQLGHNIILGLTLYGLGLTIGGSVEAATRLLTGGSLVTGFDTSAFLLELPPQVLLVAMSEEGFFRGLMLSRLRRTFSAWPAIFLQAAFFGSWHFVWHLQPLDLGAMLGRIAFTFMFGLFAGYLVHLTTSLVAPTLFHGLGNAFASSITVNPAYGPGRAPLGLPSAAFFFLTFIGAMAITRFIARLLRIQQPPRQAVS